MQIAEMYGTLNRIAGLLEGLSCGTDTAVTDALLAAAEQLDCVVKSLEDMLKNGK